MLGFSEHEAPDDVPFVHSIAIGDNLPARALRTVSRGLSIGAELLEKLDPIPHG